MNLIMLLRLVFFFQLVEQQFVFVFVFRCYDEQGVKKVVMVQS